jgi:DNA processing protein
MGFLSGDLFPWFCIWRLTGVGPKTFWHLYHETQDPLLARTRIKTDENNESACKAEWDKIHKLDGKILSFQDADYPSLLKEIPDHPPFLTVLGDTTLFQKHTISIVGARNASYAGKSFAKNLAQDLGNYDVVIASGLARGIDGAAHEGALKKGTIAVLAGGIDKIYPPEHKKLFQQIAQQGLIVSEMPLGQEPMPQLFPRRNRIVAAISFGVVLIEAARKSGSLITAEYAVNYGRDVYAVPGFPSDPRSKGCNWLIKPHIK